MSKVFQPAGNYYDKYRTRNPIARAMMNGFLGAFDQLTATVGAGEAIEIGCGEGELSMRLARRGWRVQACDIAPDAIAEARSRMGVQDLHVEYQVAGIDEAAVLYPPAPLVVCCEVLEHLEDPRAALDALISMSSGFILVSVPREPIWRALNVMRGRYLADLGNTPGHIQHWSTRAFTALLGEKADVVEVRTPWPWTMALLKPRRP